MKQNESLLGLFIFVLLIIYMLYIYVSNETFIFEIIKNLEAKEFFLTKSKASTLRKILLNFLDF